MREINKNIWSGGVLLGLCVVLIIQIPGQVGTTTDDSLSPAFLPMLVTALIAVMSVFLIVQGVLTKDIATATPVKQTFAEIGYVGLCILVMIIYVGILKWVGFIVATFAVIVVLALLYGNRNWLQILITAMVAPPAIMLFFRYTMLVLLPEGTLFN